MAAKKKTSTTQIITSTAEEAAVSAVGSTASDTVYIACGLPLGITFDDVDTPSGGVKTVTLPGINHALRGKAKGILLGDGNAVLVCLERADWECIKRKHGGEKMFRTMPPLLLEMSSEQEFKARRDEVAEMKTGVSPVDPTSLAGIEVAER